MHEVMTIQIAAPHPNESWCEVLETPTPHPSISAIDKTKMLNVTRLPAITDGQKRWECPGMLLVLLYPDNGATDEVVSSVISPRSLRVAPAISPVTLDVLVLTMTVTSAPERGIKKPKENNLHRQPHRRRMHFI